MESQIFLVVLESYMLQYIDLLILIFVINCTWGFYVITVKKSYVDVQNTTKEFMNIQGYDLNNYFHTTKVRV